MGSQDVLVWRILLPMVRFLCIWKLVLQAFARVGQFVSHLLTFRPCLKRRQRLRRFLIKVFCHVIQTLNCIQGRMKSRSNSFPQAKSRSGKRPFAVIIPLMWFRFGAVPSNKHYQKHRRSNPWRQVLEPMLKSEQFY